LELRGYATPLAFRAEVEAIAHPKESLSLFGKAWAGGERDAIYDPFALDAGIMGGLRYRW
jgi:hypothetical protein